MVNFNHKPSNNYNFLLPVLAVGMAAILQPWACINLVLSSHVKVSFTQKDYHLIAELIGNKTIRIVFNKKNIKIQTKNLFYKFLKN